VSWLAVAIAASFCIPFALSFIARNPRTVGSLTGVTNWYPTPLVYWLGSILALQSVLLLANLSQGRVLGNGDIMLGLGAGPMRRRKLIAVFAVLMIGWICNYVAVLIRFRALANTISTGLPSARAAEAQIPGHPIVMVMALLLAMIVAPLLEELFFRGWLWTGLRRSWGAWPTALITGGLWLVAHAPGGPLRVPLLLPQAILLSLARHYGGSARASLVIHIVNNTTAAVAATASVMLRPY
jgi:membrane protease YdiL (CAAX protease family)